jgi:hypothetical protein
MAPSAPATASTSVAGESAASFVGGGSPKVPSSLKAAAPRERSAAVSRGPGGTGSAGPVGVEAGVRVGTVAAARRASAALRSAGGRWRVSAERSRSSIARMRETMPVRVGSSDCARFAASSAPDRSSSVRSRRASAKFAS